MFSYFHFSLTLTFNFLQKSTNYKIFGSRQEYKTIYFKCEIVSNDKFLLNEGQKYKFHSFDQVKKLNIVPWDLVAIHLVQISLIKKKEDSSLHLSLIKVFLWKLI